MKKTRNRPSASSIFYATKQRPANLSEFAEWVSDLHLWSRFEQEWSEFIPDIFCAIQSLTHRSFYHENKDICLGDNERLEFLGDAVLDAIVVTELFIRLPECSEGVLSRLKNTLVNEGFLAELARMMEMQAILLVGKGELHGGGLHRDSLLSSVYEAYLGAVYLTHGHAVARSFVLCCFKNYEQKHGVLLFSPSMLNDFDAKSRLQEQVMKVFKTPPRYHATALDSLQGASWRVCVEVQGQQLLCLEGESKKTIEVDLAKQILQNNLLSYHFPQEFNRAH